MCYQKSTSESFFLTPPYNVSQTGRLLPLLVTTPWVTYSEWKYPRPQVTHFTCIISVKVNHYGNGKRQHAVIRVCAMPYSKVTQAAWHNAYHNHMKCMRLFTAGCPRESIMKALWELLILRDTLERRESLISWHFHLYRRLSVVNRCISKWDYSIFNRK